MDKDEAEQAGEVPIDRLSGSDLEELVEDRLLSGMPAGLNWAREEDGARSGPTVGDMVLLEG